MRLAIYRVWLRWTLAMLVATAPLPALADSTIAGMTSATLPLCGDVPIDQGPGANAQFRLCGPSDLAAATGTAPIVLLAAVAVTANGSLGTLPANALILGVYLQETAGNAVTGGVNIGTSSAGAQVVGGATLAANGLTTINPGALAEQQLGGATIWISSSNWNGANVNIEIAYIIL